MFTSEIEIPNKSSFKLNEVCGLTGVKPYVLRFWESEFEEIGPTVSSTGQKLFEHDDIDAILQVKELLFEEKMSIEKAKMELSLRLNSTDEVIDNSINKEELLMVDSSLEQLSAVKERLENLLESLELIKSKHNWNH